MVPRPSDGPDNRTGRVVPGLTDDAPFPCRWLGGTLDGLAARYPEVIEYYLGNGRAQLEAQLRDLSSVAGLHTRWNLAQQYVPSTSPVCS